jgi:CheY-like chemotaxis protein
MAELTLSYSKTVDTMPQNVLLIDDDPDFRQQAKKTLQDAGYNVTEVEGENQAYEIARNKKFDIAVVDLILENNDSGFSLSYHFKKDYPKMPILMLSDSTSEFGIEFSLESAAERSWIKADVLLNKPIRTEQLLHAVRRLLPQ